MTTGVAALAQVNAYNSISPGSRPPLTALASPFSKALRPTSQPDNDHKIDQTIAYMAAHLNQPLNVATLASVANISCSHFFVVFKRRTGQAPIDFFIHLRMGQARRLLEETGMSVKDIAGTLGYDDPFYFSRLFKSVNKMAPTDYRARVASLERSGRGLPINSSSDKTSGCLGRCW